VGTGEKNQAYAVMTKRKGQFGNFDPQKKKKNIAKIQRYGCHEYGHYKNPKLKKDNKKRIRESHITEEVEEAENMKSKKEEVIYLHY